MRAARALTTRRLATGVAGWQIAYSIGKLILTHGDAFLAHADTLLPWFLDRLSPSSPPELQVPPPRTPSRARP